MDNLTLDIFANDAFRNATLSAWVNEQVPFVPGLIGSLGMFNAQGVYTQTVGFDELDGVISLIPTSPRSAPPSQDVNMKGKTRSLRAVHLAREAVIKADEIAAIRVIGTVGQLRTAERLVQSRVEGPLGLKAQLGYTLEHLYIGTIDGQVYDADGATLLYDFFDFFGVSRTAAINIAFSTLTTDGGVFATALTGAKRTMVRALNGLPLAGGLPIVLCGDNYYDAAWSNKEVVAARKIQATGNPKALETISNNNAFDSFTFNKVTFINYRGSDDGKVSIPTAEGRLFMAGVPGLFQTYFGPADTWDLVNTEGVPSYLLQRPERQTSSLRAFEVQSNPLPMCMRPTSLIRMTMS